MPEIATILLAAGLSRRMGPRNKLLLPIKGVPMIRHLTQTYLAAFQGRVLVVTGHQTTEIEASLADLPVDLVHNADFEHGQVTSVICGLENVPKADLLLMGLGDQPLLAISDLRGLLAAHKAADPGKISIPRNGETRGNPIVIPAQLRTRLLTDPRAPGCKKFTRAHPEHVQFHDLPARGFYADIDTPEAYAALKDTVAAEPS
ncbi:nucleotidyltransferase family protein [Gymnodinialimonas sp. 2305UL16-5]|uniref:nucleotidyltransferase family protein n=1 Tax=Gymnodinialimonas mytili TaxID=3126503 RepID=UPI0030996169